MIRLQSCRWENSAKIVGILMSGPLVKNHMLPTALEHIATRRITCPSLFPDYQPDLSSTTSTSWTQRQMTPRQVQQPHEVGVHAVEHGETFCMIPQTPKTKKYEDTERARTLRRMTCRNGWRNSLRIQCREPLHLELSRKVVSGRHSIFTHFPKEPKLRSMQKDHKYKGSLQTTHWQCSTSSRKFW